VARFLTMDKSDLEEMANDLEELEMDMWLLINSPTKPLGWKTKLEQMRYKIAIYLDPICCVCGRSPARYVNNSWYCERCVITSE